ncbi:NADH:flavin oxidoreductase, partial [Amylibacter sp.]|nr:NADH:flavin oxidoreductase [Amylibacter sp.]
MPRDPRFNILFEPLKIGPVTTKNRFYQVPHCTGSGWHKPRTLAGLREVKAEGGWGVVNTEYCSIHPSSDDAPHPSASLWDKGDIKSHALMTEKVHAHGALAGVELVIGGSQMANLGTREVALAPSSLMNTSGNPFQTRAMDKSDIRNARMWHRKAALRAKEAGFDIVYVYATHGYLISQFLSPTTNKRIDEYGGNLANRMRFMHEIIEDTKEAVGDKMAVAVRFSAETNAHEPGGDGNPIPGETEEILGSLGELPDLWDININDYSLEMGLSRFTKEAALTPYVKGIKKLTSKPVVTVGRFTSPDTMLAQIKDGIVDLIGAARPS